MRIKFLLVSVIILLMITGCSNSGGNNPVLPSQDNLPFQGIQQVRSAADVNRVLLGLWEIQVDASHQNVEAIPARTFDMHLNLTNLLENTGCLSIQLLGFEPPNKLSVDMVIKHPFDEELEFTCFDMRGVFMTDGDYNFPENHRYVALGESLPRLENYDGYTTLFNPVEFPPDSPVPPIFKYFPGIVCSGDLSATLNPYVAYNTEVERRMFLPGTQVSRTLEIIIPDGPFGFGYAIDACWADPGGEVLDPETDFPLDANCLEAYKTLVEIGKGIDQNAGTSAPVTVEVYDHQGESTINSVTVESPELFNGEISLDFSTASGEDSCLFSGIISNELGALYGDYPLLVKVSDYQSDPNLGNVSGWQLGTATVGQPDEWILDFPIYWDKGPPYTCLNPQNDEGAYGAWSCGQVAHAMILRYWSLQGKIHPQGTYFYPYKCIDLETGVFEWEYADFNEPFLWDDMLETINGLDCDDPDVYPIADFVHRFCNGLRTHWWCEIKGDFDRHRMYKMVLVKYFGIDPSEYDRTNIYGWVEAHSWHDLYERIDSDLLNGQPCELFIKGLGGGGHEVVITGFRIVDDHSEYTINFGHGPTSYDPTVFYKLYEPIEAYDDMSKFRISFGIKPYENPFLIPLYNKITEHAGSIGSINRGAIAWNGIEYAALVPGGTSDDRQLYFQRISSSGLPVGEWPDQGLIQLPYQGYNPVNAEILWTGSNYGAVWLDNHEDDWGIYFVRLSEFGEVIPDIIYLGNYLITPQLAWSGSEYALVMCEGSSVNFLRISSDGDPYWSSQIQLGSGRDPDIIWTGSEYAVTWVDNENLYLVFLNGLGIPGPVHIKTIPDANACTDVRITCSGDNLGFAWAKSSGTSLSFCQAGMDGQFSNIIEVIGSGATPVNLDLNFYGNDYILTYRLGQQANLSRVSKYGEVSDPLWISNDVDSIRSVLGDGYVNILYMINMGAYNTIEVESCLVPLQ